MISRTETDFIGPIEIPASALYGIHSVRAVANFPDSTRFQIEWYRAVGTVKRACYHAYIKYAGAVRDKYPDVTLPIPLFGDDVTKVLMEAATEVEAGRYFDSFLVPSVQGGAGTSINMNINEIIANRALQMLDRKPGDYAVIDPIEQANVFQSTNDVIPTSLKVAAMRLLMDLETSVNDLRVAVEEKEKENRYVLRVGYTQMQEAVPSSMGRLFSTYCDALSRDWWRISKCLERLKPVNLGGSAIGTGISVPRFFMQQVIQSLQEITGLPLTRAENLQDATANLDALTEVHAILKAHAVNLEKIVSDLRLLSSDLHGTRELQIPQRQVGSSIMPGKVNPVIPEFVISAAHKVYSNDQLITSLCAQGCLDLNAYLPVIGHALLDSLKLLIACDTTLQKNMFEGIRVNPETAHSHLIHSPTLATALLPYLGYNKAAELAKEMKNRQISIMEANRLLNLLPEEKLLQIIDPQNLLKEGFTLNDMME
jgi:aspartate ammonia-lyase